METMEILVKCGYLFLGIHLLWGTQKALAEGVREWQQADPVGKAVCGIGLAVGALMGCLFLLGIVVIWENLGLPE